ATLSTVLLIALFLAYYANKKFLHYSNQEMGLKKVEKFNTLVCFIAIGISVGIVSVRAQLFLSQTMGRSSDVFYEFIAVLVAAPIIEEILFRGFVFRYIEIKTKSGVLALLLSSLAFASLHIGTISIGLTLVTKRFLAKFISGFLYGVLFYRFRNLLPSMIAHFTNNLIGFVMVS
ncbi:MAG: CPBP family intramembrane metalloprotease, partial [Methanocellales archaeon]|nr:CPBP family intramembrane metalloprotease [Methanocellales archaeon]